jgi:methylmalonyl-CoA/ethylmalonyl-CoA epimerase
MFTKGLDHVAIVVPDTEEALEVWRERFGFTVLFEEKVNNDTILLTHLDLGNAHLQLVQPLTREGPLWEWLEANGPGLHHLCLVVEDVDTARKAASRVGMPPGEPRPHQGTQGQRALFLDPAATGGVRVELTGD